MRLGAGNQRLAINGEAQEQGVLEILERFVRPVVDLVLVAEEEVFLVAVFARIDRAFLRRQRQELVPGVLGHRPLDNDDGAVAVVGECRDPVDLFADVDADLFTHLDDHFAVEPVPYRAAAVRVAHRLEIGMEVPDRVVGQVAGAHLRASRQREQAQQCQAARNHLAHLPSSEKPGS